MSYYNPFQNYEIRIPKKYRDEVDRFCQTQPGGGKKPSPEDSPFSRQIDLWFAAFCIGVSLNRPADQEGQHKVITGQILSRDPSRIHLIEIAAINYTDNPYIIDDPREVIKLANKFAAKGIPKLIEMLESGHSKPIWNLTEGITGLKN